LSMDVSVNLHNQKGPMLAKNAPQHPVFSTDVYTQDRAEANALIAKIIHANSGPVTDSAQAKSAIARH